MVKDIGTELLRAERTAKEISFRRFVNILVMYLVAILLFVANGLVVYYKFIL